MLPEYTLNNLLLIAALWLLLPLLNPRNKKWRVIVLLPVILINIFYLMWRYSHTLEPLQWQASSVWQGAFFITEVMVVVYCIWQCITLTRFTDRTAQADQLVSESDNSASVDLYIPTHSESWQILSGTIAAAKEISCDGLTIWICDDSARDWLREDCERAGVRYLSRPVDDPLRTKAANLAWCMPQGSAEFIVCLDADFQPEPNLLERLLCFFNQSEIGLVQAPQHFRNLDALQRNLNGGQSWTEEQRFFFDISLPSRDGWDNALCVGSCWAMRRSILSQMNGFPTESVVEDVYLGYRIKSLGYKTVYLNERLATGLAAEDAPSYVTQRSRWCLGAMTLLTEPHGPIRSRRLSIKDRLFYLEIPFYWLTHIHLLMLLLAPLMYGFFGLVVFKCSITDFLLILVPKNIFTAATFYWISQGRCMPVITPVQKTLALFHVLPSIGRGLFAPESAKFKVTKKDIHYGKKTIHWRLAAPFVVLGVATVLATGMTLSQNFNRFDWTDYSAFNTLLSAYSLIAVLLCCIACVDRPVQEKEPETPLQGSWWKTTVALANRIFV